MRADKKPWFHRVSFNFWLPISWEGWLMMAGLIAGIMLIPTLNHLSSHEPISLKRHWPALAELAVLVIAFYWLSRGHVRR